MASGGLRQGPIPFACSARICEQHMTEGSRAFDDKRWFAAAAGADPIRALCLDMRAGLDMGDWRWPPALANCCAVSMASGGPRQGAIPFACSARRS
eukprot:6436281-Pyramimonas_sp.AAC.1